MYKIATIVAYAFYMYYFKNTTIVAYASLKVKGNHHYFRQEKDLAECGTTFQLFEAEP